ncbi:MAG: tyrosine--tRNA ligase [Kiritimatiellae bacterium]|nr:tyrosine--tRNA ligase [Kiritimatiellia bacterium]
MKFLDTLKSRHLFEAVTNPELENALAKPLTVYAGFDPTSDSLQAGNFVTIQMLARLQRAGHRVIALVGGATGLIGDPSGKSVERKMLTVDQVEYNVQGIKENLSRFLHFDDPVNPAILVNNYDWYKNVSAINFLRDICVNFRVPAMLAKESVKKRLEATDGGMTFTEFSYQILQGYDYLHLFDNYGCTLEVGGADQWGNITAGTDLVHRLRGTEVYGLTFPLVCDSTGKKFGKSEGNAIFLDSRKTPYYDFYQFFMRSMDADVIRYLKIFTFKSDEEIASLEESLRNAPEKREAQQALADEMTLMVHGETGLRIAKQATSALFGGSLDGLTADDLEKIFSTVKSASLSADAVVNKPAYDVIADAGMVASKGEARRLVQQGGLSINNNKVTDKARVFSADDFIGGRVAVLRSGKKNYFLLKLCP